MAVQEVEALDLIDDLRQQRGCEYPAAEASEPPASQNGRGTRTLILATIAAVETAWLAGLSLVSYWLWGLS
jgi:hypothetical protein